MNNNIEIPWSKKELYADLFLMITLVIFATILILLKNWVILIIYWLLWLIIIIIGRVLICRHCDYLGKPCPTWCLGIIGGKLFKRSDKKDFTEISIWNFYSDVILIAIMMIFPLIVYIFYLIIEGLVLFEWVLAILYLIVGITTFIIHTKGCRKCNIKGCPFGKNK